MTATQTSDTRDTAVLQQGTPVFEPYTYAYSASRVRLTISEVEELRKVAKKDKRIRDIFQKFTDHIELIVDFK